MSIQDKAHRPWAALLGLLAGFGVAVVCVYRDLDPDVILLRSIVSGLACGLTLWISRVTIRFFQS
jgi:hypothetical protein